MGYHASFQCEAVTTARTPFANGVRTPHARLDNWQNTRRCFHQLTQHSSKLRGRSRDELESQHLVTSGRSRYYTGARSDTALTYSFVESNALRIVACIVKEVWTRAEARYLPRKSPIPSYHLPPRTTSTNARTSCALLIPMGGDGQQRRMPEKAIDMTCCSEAPARSAVKFCWAAHVQARPSRALRKRLSLRISSTFADAINDYIERLIALRVRPITAR